MTLLVGYTTDGGKNYDPVVAANPNVTPFLLPAYDRLFTMDGDGEAQPMLAESGTFSEDGLELAVKIREDVKFHDGTDLTAEAVKENLLRARDLEESTIKGELAAVNEIRVEDEYSLVIELSEPNAAIRSALAGRAGMMVSPAAFENSDLDVKPVGAGPYRLETHVPGDRVVFERFDDYYLDRSEFVDTIDITIQPDAQTRMRALQSGDIDTTPLTVSEVREAEGIAGVEVETHTSSSVFVAFLNMDSERVFGDEDVRRAASLAIDRQGISASIMQDMCEPTDLIMPNHYWAAEQVPAEDPAFDADEARALLDGQDVTISIGAINIPPFSTVLEAVGDQLEQVGFNVDMEIAPPAEVLPAFTASNELDGYITQYPGAPDPAAVVAATLMPTGNFNPGGASLDGAEDLAARGVETLERIERVEVYSELVDAARAATFHIPICAPQSAAASVEGVSGVRLSELGGWDYSNVSKVER